MVKWVHRRTLPNEDIVIPATNREAAQTYGAQAGDGLQGYGLRVLYTKK